MRAGLLCHIARAPAVAALIWGTALGLLATGAGRPQQMDRADDTSAHTLHQPYGVETFGAFRNMMLTGDFSPKVQLSAAMAKRPTTGVGAVADARGEITIFDGKLIVSYGRTGVSADANSEAAALLVLGSVTAWQSVRVAQDLEPSEIESFLAAAAKAHGIDPEKPFPFEVRGTIMSYAMHVNTAPTSGPHGMGLPMATTVDHTGDPIDSLVAGLYVSADLMGVATHGGQRTHAHWVSPDSTLTAHLDRWGLKKGAILLLPKP
jgi:hypothetical protein